VIENPGFLARDSLGRKSMAEKEEDLTKMERMICRERPKNSAEMLYSRCENFAEVAQSIPAHHHHVVQLPKLESLSHHSFNKSK